MFFNLEGWAKIQVSSALDDFSFEKRPRGDCAFCIFAAPVFHSNDLKTFEVYGSTQEPKKSTFL